MSPRSVGACSASTARKSSTRRPGKARTARGGWGARAPRGGGAARVGESFPDVVVAAAEPLPGDEVMGLRSLADGYVPPILDMSKLDRKLLVTNEKSVAGLRLLLEREGIFGGASSGAGAHAALRLADELDEGGVLL